MTFQSSIVEKMSTLPIETIHIMPECVVHLHGHQNKVVPLMKPSILVDLNNSTKFHSCIASQLITFEAIVFHIGSVTTTSTTKT
jgi:hypothetical protein